MFQFKTREANGLILYNAGRERDFIAVELVNGHVHYVFDLGDGPVRIRDTSKSKLNDGKWHAVSIGRPASKRHTLAVDDHVTAVNSQGSNENLDLDGLLYIGEYDQLRGVIIRLEVIEPFFIVHPICSYDNLIYASRVRATSI